MPSSSTRKAEVISLVASSSVQIRSYCRSSPGSQAKREPSWCSIIPGSGLRGRFLRCAARFFAGRTNPEACSTLLVQP
ncbi:MAG: hypothetical protein ACM3ML_20000 [Micromonosporaceae bacterium]